MKITATLICALACLSTSAQNKIVFTVNPNVQHQQIDCFGASDAWSMRFIGEMPELVQDDVARLLFSSEVDVNGNPEGIGLRLALQYRSRKCRARRQQLYQQWHPDRMFPKP